MQLWKIQSDPAAKKELKKTYGETLESLIKEGKDIIACDSDLVGSSGAGNIFKNYPDHSVNFGICEQNMIAAGAAMSRVGTRAYVHSFSPFVSRRVMDQIYVSAAFSKNDLHIFASEPGYWSQYNGATHTTFEDLAIMRAIPNVTVFSPSDAVTFEWMLRYYADNGGVIYDRATRRNVPLIYEEGSEFTYGKSNLLRQGRDALIIAEGPLVYDALQAADELEQKDISVSVIDILFIKPLDRELIDDQLKKHNLVVTVENHNIYGGIGEEIGTEIALIQAGCSFRRLGVQDRFGQVGTVDYLKYVYYISKDDIVRTVEEALKKE